MKKSLFFLLVLGLVTAGCSSNNKAATSDENASQPAASDNAANPSSASTASTPDQNADQQFITEAAQGNRAEVELGKLVESKAKDPNVKKFAQEMVKDHTQALDQLQQIAQSKNMTVPDGIASDDQDLQSKLSSESGKQLEKDYMDNMVQDHQKDVQAFQDAAQNAKDPDVKQYASNLVPKLQQHLQHAQQLDQKLNGGKSSKSSSAPTGASE